MGFTAKDPVNDTFETGRQFISPDQVPRETYTVPLSITDNVAALIPRAQGAWYFNGPPSREAFIHDNLITSLKHTLSAYPHFTGQLSWYPVIPNSGYKHRAGRLRLRYGHDQPSRCLVVEGRCNLPIDQVVPDAAQRGRCFDATSLNNKVFLGENEPMPLYDCQTTGEELASMVVKLTKFACGGQSISLHIVHAMCDGAVFFAFVRKWSDVNKALVQGERLPQVTATFNPQLINNAAAGDIDSSAPDPKFLEKGASMPIQRQDWWSSPENAPDLFAPLTRPPPGLSKDAATSPSFHMNWNEWDLNKPVSAVHIIFSHNELTNMQTHAEATKKPDTPRLSKMDCLLAHVWTLVNRARGFDPAADDGDVFFNFALSFSNRITPRLPSDYAGCAMFLAYSSVPAKTAADPAHFGTAASAIRSTITSLDSETVPAVLHQWAHDEHAQRYAQFFAGKRHLSSTSWLHQQVQELDFGGGEGARFVEPLIVLIDGFVTILEAKAGEEAGLDATVHLATESMERLLKDPLLRRFADDEEKTPALDEGSKFSQSSGSQSSGLVKIPEPVEKTGHGADQRAAKPHGGIWWRLMKMLGCGTRS